jgi:protein-tyrosine phosphatase
MAEIFPIREVEGVALAIMPRPRSGDWLDDEIADWSRAGICTVVSLLESSEIAELQLERESTLCAAQGIKFISFPIPDRGLPPSLASVDDLVRSLVDDVKNLRMVAVHCRAGIGRSSVVAAAILLRTGVQPDKVLPILSRARGLSVPDTEAQARWVQAYAQSAS